MTNLQIALLALVALAVIGALIYQARRPAPPVPTADERKAEQLAAAHIDLLDHQAKAEYHAAMAQMLQARIARLEGPQP